MPVGLFLLIPLCRIYSVHEPVHQLFCSQLLFSLFLSGSMNSCSQLLSVLLFSFIDHLSTGGIFLAFLPDSSHTPLYPRLPPHVDIHELDFYSTIQQNGTSNDTCSPESSLGSVARTVTKRKNNQKHSQEKKSAFFLFFKGCRGIRRAGTSRRQHSRTPRSYPSRVAWTWACSHSAQSQIF